MEVGGRQIGKVTCGGSPNLSCKRDQILWTGGLPHQPEVPYLHVNRLFEYIMNTIAKI